MSTKAAIIGAVEDQPGLHFRALQRAADCSVNTLNHHLRRSDYLHDRDIRGYRRVYTADIPDELYSPLGALNHPVRGRLLYTIDQEPAISGQTLADLADITRSTLSTHLSVLAEADLVEPEQDGRVKRYRVATPVSRSITAYADNVLDVAADRFIDLWD